jgi:hypothetical protein
LITIIPQSRSGNIFGGRKFSGHLALRVAALLITGLLFAGSAAAQAPDPDSLTIRGMGKAQTVYSINQLRNEFTLRERVTATPWSGKKTISFRGPLLKDILSRNNVSGAREFEVQAYNDFMARVTAAEIDTYSPILALEQKCVDEDRSNGLCSAGQSYRPLSVDDGGPLYLIWPLQDLPEAYVLGRKSIWVWFVVAVQSAQ